MPLYIRCWDSNGIDQVHAVAIKLRLVGSTEKTLWNMGYVRAQESIRLLHARSCVAHYRKRTLFPSPGASGRSGIDSLLRALRAQESIPLLHARSCVAHYRKRTLRVRIIEGSYV